MKKVLIVGQKGYIASSLRRWLEQSEAYEVQSISVRDDMWKEKDFASYDSICFAVGLAHIKETEENAKEYYRINKDLAIQVAQKAEEDGVAHFIYLSSTSVYNVQGEIGVNTKENPNNHYGKSKLEAEEQLKTMCKDSFKVAIVRPPMVYGKDCPGNYGTLRKIALKLPCFPKTDNMRSMIFIDNLCEFVKLLIERKDEGIFHPQNKKYVDTADMVRLIAEMNGKRMHIWAAFKPLVSLTKVMPGKIGKMAKKAFGSQYYSQALSEYPINYNVCEFEETIHRTEN